MDRPVIKQSRDSILNTFDSKNVIDEYDVWCLSSVLPKSLTEFLDNDVTNSERFSILTIEKESIGEFHAAVILVLSNNDPMYYMPSQRKQSFEEMIEDDNMAKEHVEPIKNILSIKHLVTNGKMKTEKATLSSKVPRSGFFSFRQEKGNDWYGHFLSLATTFLSQILVKSNCNKNLGMKYAHWLATHYLEHYYPDIFSQGESETLNAYVYRILTQIMPKGKAEKSEFDALKEMLNR